MESEKKISILKDGGSEGDFDEESEGYSDCPPYYDEESEGDFDEAYEGDFDEAYEGDKSDTHEEHESKSKYDEYESNEARDTIKID